MSVASDKDLLIEEFGLLYEQNKGFINNGNGRYFQEIRDDAINNFKKWGLPHKKDENYKYTDITSLFLQQFQKRFTPREYNINLHEIFSCDIPDLDTNVILLLNGFFYNNKEGLLELPSGLITGSLSKAFEQYPEVVKKHYAQYANDEKEGLVALNTAFVQDGIFVYAPKSVKMQKPIQIINILLDEEDSMVQHRNLFVLEPNSEANLVICDHSLSPKKFLTNSVTEIFADHNSHFDITKIQNEHNLCSNISGTYIHQKPNSSVTSNTITLHGGVVRNNVNVEIAGEGCESNNYGLFLADKSQHVDNFLCIDHAKPNSTSNQQYKGILDDIATGAFNGKILVRRDAQQTNAYQSNNNILLTDDAKINTKPQLEIYADDVKCSHGATVGQLNEDAMFYLRARGIDKKEAEFLLMYAFAHEIINKIKVEPLKERINELVDKRLRGELSRCNNCVIQCH